MKLSEEEKRKFVAILMAQYGIAMNVDNELLPVYYLAFRSGILTEDIVMKFNRQSEETSQKLETTAEEFNKATQQSLLKLQPKQFHFTSAKQAFWFSGGWPGVPVVLKVLLLCGMWFNYQSNQTQKEDSSLITKFIEQSEVIDIPLTPRTTARVIKLLPAKNWEEAQEGKHFLYDKKCNCAFVPVAY